MANPPEVPPPQPADQQSTPLQVPAPTAPSSQRTEHVPQANTQNLDKFWNFGSPVAGFVILLLQANGMTWNWIYSTVAWIVCVAVLVWSFSVHMVPHIKRKNLRVAWIVVYSLFWCSVAFAGTFHEYHKEHSTSTEAASVDDAVKFELFPAPGQMNFYNKGKGDVLLYGDKMANMPMSMDAPRVIPEGDFYYILTDLLEAFAKTNIGSNGKALYPLDCYIANSKGKHYIAHYGLYVVMRDGVFTLHTQQLGIEKKEWPKPQNTNAP